MAQNLIKEILFNIYRYDKKKKYFTLFISERAFVSPIARRCSISSRAAQNIDKNHHYENVSEEL